MKSITLKEFKNSLDSVIESVVGVGDIVRVKAGRQRAFVIMEEPEYKIMNETLKMMFALNNIADESDNININNLLKKSGNSSK